MIHGLLIWLGITNASGHAYLFWSGIGANFGELTIIGAGWAIYRRHNCHAHRCWRISRLPVTGTPFTTCRKHHPTYNTQQTAEQITQHHDEAAHRMRCNLHNLELDITQAVAHLLNEHTGADMTAQQDHLNATITAFADVVTSFGGIVTDLKTQLADGNLDFTAADAAVASAQAAVTAATPSPVVVDPPVDPAVDPNAAV